MIIPIKPWLELLETDASHFSRPDHFAEGLVLASDEEAEQLWKERRGHEALPLDTNTDRMKFYHEPIMAQEILAVMRPLSGKQIVDGTLGGGGHSELLLAEGAHVIGCDQDGAALDHAASRLGSYGDQFLPLRGNFSGLDELLTCAGVDKVDGILLDLGVSSRQLDDPSRGFSFREDGPLDMRMDSRSELTAFDLVNAWAEDELIRIFRDYGEERRARRVAKEIVKERAKAPIETTLQLSSIVGKVIPKTSGKNPATRVFQAIRIAVNRELESLESVLEKSGDLLEEGGILAIITFHSLEDRIVKRFLRDRSAPFLDRPEWPEPRENPDYIFNLISRKAISPSESEVSRNSRARSAKLRLAVRV
ncbi:MAG: 16S rRNA (cytosine(1402)-N(4))-methyltransferase RsmH [Verrucomicrobiota bacterium]